MFKAKLIENESYYKLRSKQYFLILVPYIVMLLIIAFCKIPFWLTIALIGIYTLTLILVLINKNKINSILGSRLIEIDGEEIRIKSMTGAQQEVIRLADLDKLIVKKNYSIPLEKIEEIGSELSGKAKRNYVILQKNSERRKLDFEIDTHFMVIQLNKIIEKWEFKGYTIERIIHE